MADVDLAASLQRKAEQLIGEGKSKSSRSVIIGWVKSFGDSSSAIDKYEEALDNYLKAAEILAEKERYIESGQSHEKAAGVYIMMSDKRVSDDSTLNNKAGDQFAEASKAYIVGEDYPAALRCLESAIARFYEGGNRRRAISLREQQGDMYLAKFDDATKAMECFKEAAKWYLVNGNQIIAARIKAKHANILASEFVCRYAEAKQMYEQAAKLLCEYHQSKDSKAWIAHPHFFSALLCAMAADPIIVQRMMDEYVQIPSLGFKESTQYKDVELLLRPVLEGDEKKFWDCCPKEPSPLGTKGKVRTPLTDLQWSILHAIKRNISTSDGVADGEDFS